MELVNKGAIPLPKRYEDKPIMPDHLVIYRQAFDELNSSRHYENGPIPALAIEAWSDRNGLDPFQRFQALRLVRMLDNAFLKFLRDREKAERERQEKAAKAKRKRGASNVKRRPRRR